MSNPDIVAPPSPENNVHDILRQLSAWVDEQFKDNVVYSLDHPVARARAYLQGQVNLSNRYFPHLGQAAWVPTLPRERVAADHKSLKPVDWREAVNEELIGIGMDIVSPNEEPRAALKRLIDMHCTIALDPTVSPAAAKLLEGGEDPTQYSPSGLGVAEVWHQGDQSFYRARLIRKLTHAEYVTGCDPAAIRQDTGKPDWAGVEDFPDARTLIATMCDGLAWNIDMHPEVMNQSDEEMLAAAQKWLHDHPEVGGKPELWQWRRKGDPWTLTHTYQHEVQVTTEDSEARCLYADAAFSIGMPEEIARLRELAAAVYAGLGAECSLPVMWLSALHAASKGRPFLVEGLLPFKKEAGQ